MPRGVNNGGRVVVVSCPGSAEAVVSCPGEAPGNSLVSKTRLLVTAHCRGKCDDLVSW